MHPLISSACERVEHFQYAFSILKNNLEKDIGFQNSFSHLLDALIKIERRAQTQKNIFFIAVGKSAGVARIAASMFVSVGLPVQFVHPTEAFHGDLGVVNSEDIVIFISNSGNSPELLQLIPGLIERRVFIYTMTSKPESPLGLKSNLILKLPDIEEKCPLYQSPITSTLTSLALCQLLVAASVEARNFTIENYAKNHPGGAIGKRIFLKIDDIMSKGEYLPCIGPLENFQKVVSVFTSFAKASLLVVENEKYLGLITERDLRTAMETFGPDVFQKTAKDMMNTSSVSVRPGILAVDALNIMTAKKPFFNVLPVVCEQGKAAGLLQLQDLFTAGL